MSELTSLTNIGKEMASKLISVGIDTPEKLIESGSKEAFFKLKEKYPQVQQEYRFQLAGQQEEVIEQSMEVENKSAEDKLMAFFDAETMEEKYQILLGMRDVLNDRMVNNMAVVLDVVIEEGPLEQRYEELKSCVRTFQKYECTRLR